jgi:putative glutamine amidotransferase
MSGLGATWNPTNAARPTIGIAPDVAEPRPGSLRATCPLTYARAIHEAGGWPVILPPILEMIPLHLERCDGFVLIGGDDPRTEPFGVPTHPKATLVHPLRQQFDTELLEALMDRPRIPTLGVCLGMQMMALVAGGAMDQHLPETLTSADRHWNDAVHRIKPVVRAGVLASVLAEAERSGGANVTSHHRQAVSNPGSLLIAAVSDDGVIEAIERPDAPFFLGVQWHPERTTDAAMGIDLIRRLVQESAAAKR